MSGPEAARLFYDPDRFVRSRAMPKAIQKTLLGAGGVQGLDDAAHRHRKRMFMTLMTAERIGRLVQVAETEWERGIERWAKMPRVVLYPEFQQLLTRAVCAWAGVPLAEPEIAVRTREIAALFDHAGSVGVRHLWSRWARMRADRWLADVVVQIRNGRLQPSQESPAWIVAQHRNLDGDLLPPRIAAVELLNVIRPSVAVSVYMTLIAHALHAYPAARARLQAADEGYTERFIQEVRRYYPFFPAVIARTRRSFEWNGYPFDAGRHVMLDLYGTNHDPRTWDDPQQFEPERFRHWDGSAFNFIPQGGGDPHTGHRCPGEWIAIELMKLATDFLTRRMAYEVPEQDLGIECSRLPAVPRSRIVISQVERA